MSLELEKRKQIHVLFLLHINLVWWAGHFGSSHLPVYGLPQVSDNVNVWSANCYKVWSYGQLACLFDFYEIFPQMNYIGKIRD